MRRLIDKYIDGQLTESEAAAFLAAVEKDPELESELRSWEALLDTVASADVGTAPAGLADDVMARVRAAAPAAPHRVRPASRPRPRWRPWIPRAAWAAGLATVFVLGRLTAPTPAGDGTIGSADPIPAALRPIRMVFVPPTDAIQQVGVAGTFNGWNAATTRMERLGNAFVVQLVLPPGSYEYMFVLDGDTWVTDPLALETRDDGFGRENAVLDVSL